MSRPVELRTAAEVLLHSILPERRRSLGGRVYNHHSLTGAPFADQPKVTDDPARTVLGDGLIIAGVAPVVAGNTVMFVALDVLLPPGPVTVNLAA